MKYNKVSPFCKCCGQLKLEHNQLTMREIEMRLGILLGLEPHGKTVDGEPYFSLYSKKGLISVLLAVQELKKEKK